MTLTKEQQEANKAEFISLIQSINREGFDKDRLLSNLEASDFFTAPASTKYHSSFVGGLVQHSLLVYKNLCRLIPANMQISQDSIKIVALLHDISKMKYYETYYKNQKIYSEKGSKWDSGGRYDWEQIGAYKVREASDRFLYGNHEATSEFIIRQYCPLTVEESIAILHHHGGMNDDSAKDNVSAIYSRYPLATLLHLADMYSVYIDESTDKE